MLGLLGDGQIIFPVRAATDVRDLRRRQAEHALSRPAGVSPTLVSPWRPLVPPALEAMPYYRSGRSAVFNTKASRTPALLSWVATSRVAMAT